MSAHIALHDVHKSFGSSYAVRGVSLDVSRNEFVTLLGPSGCGKTTLLRLIGGLEYPDRGTIEIGGALVETTPVRERRTRMVFQQYALFPHMSVARNVEFGLRVRGMSKPEREKRVRAALDLVKLGDKLQARPGQLSGGQQQRVALARAIVTEPDVLLLDEPLAALDLQLRKAMQIELKNLQQRLGITFIYVTHDQSEALAMSDRIVVMSNGLIEQIGTGEEIYRHPLTRFVGRFIGEANLIEASVLSCTGGVMQVKAGSQPFAVTRPSDALQSEEQVAFLVRPEDTRFSPLPSSTNTTNLKCRVVQRIYLGSYTRLMLQSESGLDLIADIPSENLPDLTEGFCTWDDRSIRWLSR